MQVPPDIMSLDRGDEDMQDPDEHENDDKHIEPDNEYFDGDNDHERDTGVLDV
jgi:hypothetical protein